MSAPPILAIWEGDCFRPKANFRKTCDTHFVVGEVYKIETIEERSMKAHRRYFAIVNETWASLPDHLLERFPTPVHLRKYMLIKVGEFIRVEISCDSKKEAARALTTARILDEFCIAEVKENIVIIYKAKSQAFKAMDKKEFKLCTERILDLCSELIGAEPKDLDQHVRST